MAMEDVLDRITTKVGPLPAWAWAAIPAAGYVAWSYYKASQGSGVVSDVADTGATGTDAADYGINTGGTYLPGYGSTPYGSSNLPQVDTPKFDNQGWFKLASNYLIGEGYVSSDIVTALNAYLYGAPEEISTTQYQALQKALLHLGAAPEPAFLPKWAGATLPGWAQPPQNLTVTPGATSAVFSWNPPSGGANQYVVYVYEGLTRIWSNATMATSMNMGSGLEPGHSYAVEVYAGEGGTTARYSAPAKASFTTKAA